MELTSSGIIKFIKQKIPLKVKVFLKGSNLYELVLGPLTYNQDGLASRHNCDFMKDDLFIESYNLGKATGSWGDADIHWRAHVACWAAKKARDLEGDFVECGVYKGGLSRAVINYIDFKSLNKKFYLLDTFCGLVDDYILGEEKIQGKEAGGYEECYDIVRNNFKDFDNVIIIRGAVPETLDQVRADKVSYLSIDMNCAPPEIAAMEYFWDKLVSGAVVILDDYGWSGYIHQKWAMDEFAVKKGLQVLTLPTGQGLIIKP